MGSRDMSVRIYSLEKFTNFNVCSLGGLSETCIGAFFETNSLDCYSLSKGGHLLVWESNIGIEDLIPGVATQQNTKKKVKNPDEDEDDMTEDQTDKAEV